MLLYKVRLDIGDTSKRKVSDYDLINALNAVLILVANALNNISSNLLTEPAVVVLNNDVGDLPDDFQSILAVENGWRQQSLALPLAPGTYRILGNKIYANAKTVKIIYKRFAQVDNANDDVPLPSSFTQLLVKYIKVFLEGGFTKADSEMVGILSNDVYRLASGRELTELRQKPIFKV